MNNRPVYENLDTSFVNLAALVRYLRRRQMIGRVRLEFNSYEAEILLVDSNNIKVREHDKVAGRQARLLHDLPRRYRESIRRQPGGISCMSLPTASASFEQSAPSPFEGVRQTIREPVLGQ